MHGRSAERSLWKCSRIRLASMILATVRPDAADEPKVDATWKLVVEKVSGVSEPMSVPSCRVAKAEANQAVIPEARVAAALAWV